MRSSEWVTTVVDRPARAPASDAEKVAGVEALFSRHYEPLVRSLSFVALDRDLAADAAQEAFFQLYLKWDRISQYDDPIGWVYRVAINRCKDHRRALARAARLLQWVAAGPVDRDGPSWTPEIDFRDALRRLPSRQRTAAALHYVADLSVAQVARAMDISEGAVKSHLFRARESLRAELGAES
jgi:RNA polymerase sigma-70 factor (ECF subfamily)